MTSQFGDPAGDGVDDREPTAILGRLAVGPRAGRLRHVESVPGRSARTAPFPHWLDPVIEAAFIGSGIESLWTHQRIVADAAHAGEHVVVSTGTASGKSLGFWLPALHAALVGARAPTGRGATVLYLTPTKALAQDQLARLQAWALPGVRAAVCDGDTPSEERRWIRDHANVVLTNPDLIHRSLLPDHARWAPFLRRLRYIVVDECHVYRGLFGANVAAVLRRLRRVAAHYRAEPTFILASATVAEPGRHAERLTGAPVTAVTGDGSPRGEVTFAMWQPDLVSADTRRSAVAECADLLADLVADDVQTVCFARSRVGVEIVASAARGHLAHDRPHLVGSVAAYRGGYLPEERRALERGLRTGQVRGLASTNALELGIDISGLDAVLIAGWPGSRASLWQQAGRAGRGGSGALAVLVAADNPLDAYLIEHPEATFGQPVEAAVLDPQNPHVLVGHLAAAAAELPLTNEDASWFGPSMTELVDRLAEGGVLRRRPTGWYWTRPDRAASLVDLRGASTQISIVEAGTGRVVGTVDEASAPAQVHTGAVHIHQGQVYVVSDLDLAAGAATVVAGDPGWSTQARTTQEFEIIEASSSRRWGSLTWSFGRVRVRSRVTSYLRRSPSGEVIGEYSLELPERVLATAGSWLTIEAAALESAGIAADAAPGALHGAEHAAIALLPLVASADRGDTGGVSTALHPDTGLPTVLVYDAQPGGAGFAERGYLAAPTWWQATRDALAACRCAAGCPSCVQSPRCGSGNAPLDKPGALAVGNLVLAAMRTEGAPSFGSG